MDLKLKTPQKVDVTVLGKATGMHSITITPLKPVRAHLDAHLSR